MTDSEILSQKEKDALLNDVSDESTDSEDIVTRPSEAVVSYDFSHPAHRLNSRLPVLEVINDKIARELSKQLVASFHLPIKVAASTPSFEKYQDFVHALPETVNLIQFKLEPLPGSALLIMDGELISSLVDSFFGGSGMPTSNKEPGEFTPTERRIIERLRLILFKVLPNCWSSIAELKPIYQNEVCGSQITSPANPTDVVVACKFVFEWSSIKSECQIVLPFSMLEPCRSQLTNDLQQMKEHDAEWLQGFSQGVMESQIELLGVIAESEMKLQQLLELKEGDFIPLGQSQIAEFSSENISLFDATVGISNGLVSASLLQWRKPSSI